ncbi:MAG: hypothetical protein KGS72_27350 [Cyanobacteria bacterium REEB67]|nr:hypothetical protein [Cyanobacteria bacterium REEB67]
MKSKKHACLLLFGAAFNLVVSHFLNGVPCQARPTRLQRPAQDTEPVKLTGTYDKESGKVNLAVDFTGLKLLKLRGLKSAKADLVGTIHGTTIKGQAAFPEFHDKAFQWEAVQVSQEPSQ